jgi:uncharacterized membrane protein
MKIHPVHMMIVHFPAALLPVAFLFSVIANFIVNPALTQAAYYCLLAGVIGGWVAMVTGMIDLFLYVLRSGTSIKSGLWHGGIQTTVIIGFTILLALEYNQSVITVSHSVWILVVKAILVVVMLAGNYIGAEVLFYTTAKQFRSS